MFSVKRMEEITKILEQDGCVDVGNLSKRLKVTAKTIRQDLDRLEEIGLLERVHGGAVLKQNGNGIYPIQQRKGRNLAEKVRIAETALAQVEEGETVILDGGSTNLELAKRLGEKRIVAVTNDLLIALELMHKENVTLYVTGGKLRREGVFTLLGREAERTVSKYNANKLFLGTSALDFRQGLMVLSEDEAEIKKAMIASATKVIAMVDYSKFHKLAFVSFASLKDVDLLITDSRIPPADRNRLGELGLKLEIA
ncbi:MAG: DeoR/GlpR family DNA-binding transcription regulator [Bacteroidota bacterium]